MKHYTTKITLSLSLALAATGLFVGCSKPADEPAANSAAVNGTGGVGQYVDDSTITAKVKAALAGDNAVKANEISVTTNQGVVTLSGTVQTSDQKAAAVKDTMAVGGVKDVTNLIKTL